MHYGEGFAVANLLRSRRLAGLVSALVLGGMVFLGGCEDIEEIDELEEPEAAVATNYVE